eukprot:symbB.v1.2.036474.t1/scaffold5158.1/size30252/1
MDVTSVVALQFREEFNPQHAW